MEHDVFILLRWIRDEPTTVQLLCLLAIGVVIVACGYMAFRRGRTEWLAYGAGAIAVLSGVIWLAGKLDRP